MTAARAGTSSGASDGVRPMTSVKGAGFQSKPPGTARAGAGAVDLSSARPTGPAPPLAEKADNGPEDQAKDMERKVRTLTAPLPQHLPALPIGCLQNHMYAAMYRSPSAARVCAGAWPDRGVSGGAVARGRCHGTGAR